jgi:hypothetical protein
MKGYPKQSTFLILIICLATILLNSGCHVRYGFNDVGTIPANVKTVRVNFIENRAPYVNPQLSPSLTDRLKQKIVNQTRLSQTNSDNAHFDIHGYVSDYSVSTSGITSANGQSQTSVNRLTVSVHLSVLNTLTTDPPKEFDVSRSFDFGANQSLQQAEAGLLDEMIRNLTDEIFNQIFSNW